MIDWIADDLRAAGYTFDLCPAKGARTTIHVYRYGQRCYYNTCATDNSALRHAHHYLLGTARHDVKLTDSFAAKATAAQRLAHAALVAMGVER